ncbi:uncharacterized [Tachysurus ichikawai]
MCEVSGRIVTAQSRYDYRNKLGKSRIYCLDSQASLKSLAKSLRRDRFAFKGESFLGSLHPPPTMPSFHLPRDVSWTSHLVLALLHNYLPNSPSSKPSGLELPARARDHALQREQQITDFRQRRGGCKKRGEIKW